MQYPYKVSVMQKEYVLDNMGPIVNNIVLNIARKVDIMLSDLTTRERIFLNK